MFATLLLAVLAVTQTDQTVQVQKGTRLDISNFAGDVSIKTWDKDAVRVQVTHSEREVIDITPGDQTLKIRSHGKMGPPRSLDYTISVPGWMPITVAGTYTDVTIEGANGDVSVESTRGDVKLVGGSGVVTIKAMQGDVDVQKAKGKIDVHALNQSIHLADVTGDVSAETTNGDIIVDRMDSPNVDLYTVNGNISFDGAIKDKGVYRITTHNGLIGMAIGEKVNATLMVRTYNGGFRSTFPLKLDEQNPKKRFTVSYGNGSAHVELESFGGTIALRRPGEPRPELERRRRLMEREKEKDKTKDKDGDFDETLNVLVNTVVNEVVNTNVNETINTVVNSVVRPIPRIPKN